MNHCKERLVDLSSIVPSCRVRKPSAKEMQADILGIPILANRCPGLIVVAMTLKSQVNTKNPSSLFPHSLNDIIFAKMSKPRTTYLTFCAWSLAVGTHWRSPSQPWTRTRIRGVSRQHDSRSLKVLMPGATSVETQEAKGWHSHHSGQMSFLPFFSSNLN